MERTRRRVRFTFPPDLITEPVIWRLGREFDVVTNIRRANVEENRGWVILEIDGPPSEIERALAAVQAWGVQVDPVEGDVIAG
jgi:ABC-type methionine transport system ATPase subunit